MQEGTCTRYIAWFSKRAHDTFVSNDKQKASEYRLDSGGAQYVRGCEAERNPESGKGSFLDRNDVCCLPREM
jgi:hypothetical protein